MQYSIVAVLAVLAGGARVKVKRAEVPGQSTGEQNVTTRDTLRSFAEGSGFGVSDDILDYALCVNDGQLDSAFSFIMQHAEDYGSLKMFFPGHSKVRMLRALENTGNADNAAVALMTKTRNAFALIGGAQYWVEHVQYRPEAVPANSEVLVVDPAARDLGHSLRIEAFPEMSDDFIERHLDVLNEDFERLFFIAYTVEASIPNSLPENVMWIPYGHSPSGVMQNSLEELAGLSSASFSRLRNVFAELGPIMQSTAQLREKTFGKGCKPFFERQNLEVFRGRTWADQQRERAEWRLWEDSEWESRLPGCNVWKAADEQLLQTTNAGFDDLKARAENIARQLGGESPRIVKDVFDNSARILKDDIAEWHRNHVGRIYDDQLFFQGRHFDRERQDSDRLLKITEDHFSFEFPEQSGNMFFVA